MNTGILRKALKRISGKLHKSLDGDDRLNGVAERLAGAEKVIDDMQAENRTHHKIVAANGRAVVNAKEKAKAKTVGAHGGDPDDPIEKVQAAAVKLDPADDAHWTKAGLPDLNVLSEYAGMKVLRGLANKALAGLTRTGE